jgi:hypothetical protein
VIYTTPPIFRGASPSLAKLLYSRSHPPAWPSCCGYSSFLRGLRTRKGPGKTKLTSFSSDLLISNGYARVQLRDRHQGFHAHPAVHDFRSGSQLRALHTTIPHHDNDRTTNTDVHEPCTCDTSCAKGCPDLCDIHFYPKFCCRSSRTDKWRYFHDG